MLKILFWVLYMIGAVVGIWVLMFLSIYWIYLALTDD